MDPNGEHVSSISAAVEHEGCLFMGNLAGDFVSYVDLGAVVSPNTRGGEVNGASRGGGRCQHFMPCSWSGRERGGACVVV